MDELSWGIGPVDPLLPMVGTHNVRVEGEQRGIRVTAEGQLQITVQLTGPTWLLRLSHWLGLRVRVHAKGVNPPATTQERHDA